MQVKLHDIPFQIIRDFLSYILGLDEKGMMGSFIYNFLNDSLLLDESLIKEDYRTISNVRLVKELVDYRSFCIRNMSEIVSEIKIDPSTLSCLGSESLSDLSSLKRSALYLEQMVLPDPIFPFTEEESKIANTMSEYLGLNKSSVIDKVALSKAAEKIISMRPMVAGGYVKYYPVSFHSEPPIEIPVNYSKVEFSDLLPANILKFFISRVDVKSLEKRESIFIVTDKLYLGRSISVSFKGADESQLKMYNLFEQETLSVNDETREVMFKLTLPDNPPTEAMFKKWVNQSINKSAHECFEKITKEISLAHSLGSVYTCESNLNSQLLNSSFFDLKTGVVENAIECVLRMELPYMDNISAEDLMNIRQNDGEEFQAFRIELEKQFREIRVETDASVIKRKIEDIEHELSEVQLRNIDLKIKSVRKVALADTGLAIAGLAAGIATSGASLIGSLAGFLHGCKTYAEYQEKVKENPCYFLWNVKKGARSVGSPMPNKKSREERK